MSDGHPESELPTIGIRRITFSGRQYQKRTWQEVFGVENNALVPVFQRAKKLKVEPIMPTFSAIQIEVEDVKEAARLLFQGRRDAGEREHVAKSFEPALNAMQDSFLNRCEKD